MKQKIKAKNKSKKTNFKLGTLLCRTPTFTPAFKNVRYRVKNKRARLMSSGLQMREKTLKYLHKGIVGGGESGNKTRDALRTSCGCHCHRRRMEETSSILGSLLLSLSQFCAEYPAKSKCQGHATKARLFCMRAAAASKIAYPAFR